MNDPSHSENDAVMWRTWVVGAWLALMAMGCGPPRPDRTDAAAEFDLPEVSLYWNPDAFPMPDVPRGDVGRVDRPAANPCDAGLSPCLGGLTCVDLWTARRVQPRGPLRDALPGRLADAAGAGARPSAPRCAARHHDGAAHLDARTALPSVVSSVRQLWQHRVITWMGPISAHKRDRRVVFRR